MSLLFYPFDSLSLRDPFDDLLLASPYGPPAMARAPSCGRAACAPRAAAACGPRRQSCPPPAEPEVHLTRHEDGVVAECLLGRGFDERDISLQLDGRDLELTVFHPGTAHWRVRPAAYRTTLELAPHIDAQHIEASLHSGILTLTFPYRRQPRHQPQPQPQAQHGRHTAATPAGSDPLQAFCRLAAAAAAVHADAGAAETQRVERCRRHHRAPAAAHAPYRHPHHQQQRRACKSPEQDQQARHVRWQDDDASPAATGAAQPQRCRCPALPERRARQQQQQQQQQAGPSRPAAAAAAPVEPAHPGAAPAPVEDPKGKAPASAEQAAELERQQAARRAAERIAAGSGSDSDWEVADGAVEDCPLEG